MASVRNWSLATPILGVLPLAVYLILVLDLPYNRLKASLSPPRPSPDAPRAHIPRALELLQAADPGEAAFAAERNVSIYEIKNPNLLQFAYNPTGTLAVVLNSVGPLWITRPRLEDLKALYFPARPQGPCPTL